ncbi:ABC transporter ATP-binding protein [Streptomyces sp. NPDC059679]|uniref:ABC transporter ATP-binding protein n=1 Tax=Streptomyces sp. NPDC059679 TaxID=3346903 RepID=UPI0036911EFF
MIEARGLTKRYGDRTAVEDLTFTVQPGKVTGFLGPNGAGKSTTMRMVLGLDAPTRGRVTVAGRPYAEHPAPLTVAGALLEAKSIHKGRSALGHLMALAHTHGIPRRRVEQVLDQVGLREAAGRRVGGFSLGMGQRLGIAAALLGDPGTVILDEPVNGLDPEGVRWIRTLLKELAAEGRTVFVSSHLMSEMAVTAEHLIIIGRGRLLADTTVEQFVRSAGVGEVKVVSPEAARLRDLLAAPGVEITSDAPGTLRVTGADGERIGSAAARHGIPVHELTPHTASLEEAFMELTRDAVEYREGAAA